MGQVTVNSGKIVDKLTKRLSSRLDKFNRQLMKQLSHPAKKGGIWAYDYNRRPDQNYEHSVSQWRKYKPSKGKLRYVYRNDALNNSKQHYVKYLKGEPYHSPQLTKKQWTDFVKTQRRKLKTIIKGEL